MPKNMFTYLNHLSTKLKRGKVEKKNKTFTKITERKGYLKTKHTNLNTSFKKKKGQFQTLKNLKEKIKKKCSVRNKFSNW